MSVEVKNATKIYGEQEALDKGYAKEYGED